MGEETERVKIKQLDKRGVSQRCIHSSKVTDPHPRLLLGAKCSAEKPDELMSLGRSRRRKREMGNKGVKKKKRQTKNLATHFPRFPDTALHPKYEPLKRISQRVASSPPNSVRTTHGINKSTKPRLFKYRVIMARSMWGENDKRKVASGLRRRGKKFMSKRQEGVSSNKTFEA